MSILYNECGEPFTCLSYDGDIVFDAREFTKRHFIKPKFLFGDSTVIDATAAILLAHSIFYWVIYFGSYTQGEFNPIEFSTCTGLNIGFFISIVLLVHMLYKRYVITSARDEITKTVRNHCTKMHSDYWMTEKIEKMLLSVCAQLQFTDLYRTVTSKKLLAKAYSSAKLSLYFVAFLSSAASAYTESIRIDTMISSIRRTRNVTIPEIYSYMDRNDFIYYEPVDEFFKGKDFASYMEDIRLQKNQQENMKFQKPKPLE